MYRCTARLRSWRMSNFDLSLNTSHFQLLSTASTTPSATIKRQFAEGQEPGLHDFWKDQDSGQTKAIIVDDLSATLEAHRARNRAAVIRKIGPRPDTHGLFKRPLFLDAGANDENTIHRAGGEVRTANDPVRNELESPVSEDGRAEEQDDLDGQGFPNSSATSKRKIFRLKWPADSVQAKNMKLGKKREGFTRSVDPSEYFGMKMKIDGQWQYHETTPDEFLRPWVPYMEGSSEDNLERLSNEIRAFEAYMSLSPTEEAAAQLVIAEFTSIINHLAPTYSLTLLGSRSSGLASPTSDLDVSMSIPSSSLESTETTETLNPRQLIRNSSVVLRTIEKGLRRSGQVTDIEMITARIPLVNCKHRATGLKIQLQTMASFKAAQQYTAAYLAEFPSLRPLYVVIRHFLEMRNLTTVFEGGLGSYTILMMIVTALKHASGKFAPQDLGAQLLHVLDFYGNADLYKQGFSANPPRVFEKTKYKQWPLDERPSRSNDPQLRGIDEIVQKSETRKPYLLCLQDPANFFNDLGRKAYAIKHIQVTFKHAHSKILKVFEDRDSNRPAGGRRALSAMLKANYKDFEIDRHKIECYVKRRATFQEAVDRTDDSVKSYFEQRLQTYQETQEAKRLGTDPQASDLTSENLNFKKIITSYTLDPYLRKHITHVGESAHRIYRPVFEMRKELQQQKQPALTETPRHLP
ncbi:hypothetical protein N7G274_002313 [Stereocaulon virgatum]|uniref:Poly(A) RNA polymerase mitochondrial-like central palm domain-containing protein n=1 Tax=Stereocaulon virgatum TaxID=373712 RepID=A0ABR4AHK9_9LECA